MDLRPGMVLSIAAAIASAGPGAASAAPPAEIVVDAERVFPESITSAADGSVYFGSIGNKAVYRAAPGSASAESFIAAGRDGLQSTFGVFVDNRTHILWVCSNFMGGGAPDGSPAPPAQLYAFDAGTGATRAHYAFPTADSFCNDIATLPDGTVFATDTNNSLVVRLNKGVGQLAVWAGADGSLGKGVVLDGISILGNRVIVNELAASKLFSITISKDGSAGPPVQIKTDKPISRPDGMRTFGRNGVLIVEGGDGGKLERITFEGNTGQVQLIKQGYPDGPVGVTVVGTTAYVAEGQFAAMRAAPGAAPPALKPFKATAVDVGRP